MKPTSNEMAVTWLESMSNSTDIWTSINAEQALSIISDQKRRLASLGAAFNNLKNQRNRAWEALEEARKGLKTQSERHDDPHGYFCTYCQRYAPTEVIRTCYGPDETEKPLYVRVCLRCGNEIFDRGLDEKYDRDRYEDA